MANSRKFVFANEQIYHIYNRGVEKRYTFLNKREYRRALDTMNYYRFKDTPRKFSDYLSLPNDLRNTYFDTIHLQLQNHIEILAYCLMPNHFHFLIKQKIEGGITQFMTKFTNSYTKYFNTKHKRVGPLFQGVFKATLIETEEELIHICRYIHLNPVIAFLIEYDQLKLFPWSSYKDYVNETNTFCNTRIIKQLFASNKEFDQFMHDQVSYARELDKLKHLVIE